MGMLDTAGIGKVQGTPAPRRPSQFARTFSSLRNRNFRLYYFGQLISNTGNWLTMVALTLLMLKLTHSGVMVGLLTACQFGPMLILTPPAGAIADRVDKRRMLFLTQGLEMLQSAGLAVLAFQPQPSVPAIFTLALAGGILLAFDNPARRSFISEMVPAEDIPNAVVLHSSLINLSRMFGPALAGLLVITVGYGWCFTIDALSYLAVLYGLYLMRPAELIPGLRRPRKRGEVREGMRYVLSHPKLWISFVMLALIGTLAYNFSVTFPLFVTRTLHSTESVFTLMYSTFALGAVVCALLVAHRGLVRMRHIVYGAAALGLTMLTLASVSRVPLAIPLAFCVGAASILYMTATTAIIQVEARRDMHGRVLALQMVFVGGTSVIGGPLVGWLADAVSARAPIILGGVVCLLAALFGYLATRRHASEFHPGAVTPATELESDVLVESK